MSKKKIPWQIRTSKNVKSKVKERAKHEGRSANKLVEIILCKYLQLDVKKEVGS